MTNNQIRYEQMFNTPLGKKLYENMLSLGYHMMTGKAALYTNVVAMVTDFIERKDGKIYFSKKMTYDDLVMMKSN